MLLLDLIIAEQVGSSLCIPQRYSNAVTCEGHRSAKRCDILLLVVPPAHEHRQVLNKQMLPWCQGSKGEKHYEWCNLVGGELWFHNILRQNEFGFLAKHFGNVLLVFMGGKTVPTEVYPLGEAWDRLVLPQNLKKWKLVSFWKAPAVGIRGRRNMCRRLVLILAYVV